MVNKNKKIFLMTILLLLVLGLMGYIIYDKVLMKKEDYVEKKPVVNIEQKRIVVDEPEYNVVTKQIAKSLVGKYVANNYSDVYFEIKEDGELSIVFSACSALGEYKNEELDWLAFYQKGEDGFQRTIITFIMKPGSSYTFSGSDLSITFSTTDNIEEENLKFEGTDIGCGAESYARQ